MVVGAFPVIKLGVLAFKQLSKPIANALKERAKSHPFFRKYICMPPAQFYNWVDVKTKMWVLNLGKPVNVPELSETMAIELGANLLGEIIIFSIGSGLLIFEYRRQSKKETAKEELAMEEKRDLQYTIQELALNIERQDAQIRHLSRIVAELESRKWLPKLNILKSADNNNNNTTGFNRDESYSSPVQVTQPTGNYNDNDGLLAASLQLIENEILYSEPKVSDNHRIIDAALSYLKY